MKKSARVTFGTRDVRVGRWMFLFDFLVIPFYALPRYVDEPLADRMSKLARSRSDFTSSHPSLWSAISKSHPELDRKTLESFAMRMVIMFAVIREKKEFLYKSQPKWQLKDIPIRKTEETVELLDEFFSFASDAAAAYQTHLTEPGGSDEWKSHGWKHINFASLRPFFSGPDLRGPIQREHIDPWTRSDLLGPDAANTLRAAIRQDPEAVARVDALYPTAAEKHEIQLFFRDADESSAEIATMPDLVYELARVIKSSPTSPKADQARRDIQTLTSLSASQGLRRVRGRPSIPIPDETVVEAFRKSYALVKQMREVHRLLKKFHGPSYPDRILNTWYPELTAYLRTQPSSFLNPAPIDSASNLTAKLIGASSSKVKKLVYTWNKRHQFLTNN